MKRYKAKMQQRVRHSNPPLLRTETVTVVASGFVEAMEKVRKRFLEQDWEFVEVILCESDVIV